MSPVPADPQTITVSFTLQGETPPFTATFTFDPPDPLTLPNIGGTSGTSYTVTFHLDTTVSGAVLKAATHDVIADPPPHLTVISGDETQHLTIGFDNEGLPAQDTFHYEVTVLARGDSFTSTDPELVIPPPT